MKLLKQGIYTLLLPLFALTLPLLAFAQDILPPSPSQGELELLVRSLGGDTSMKLMALVALLVQVSMFVLAKTSIADKLAGKHKIVLVYALNIVAGVLTLRLMGVETVTALVHSNTLASYQVFLHQVWKQFAEKKV